MTSDVISQILTGGLVVLALVIVALAIDRRRWQEIAQNRHRFILDLKAASRCPQSWVFGPSYLAELRRRWEDAELRAACKASCLEATSQELDRQRARADAVTGQAKWWARIARSRDGHEIQRLRLKAVELGVKVIEQADEIALLREINAESQGREVEASPCDQVRRPSGER